MAILQYAKIEKYTTSSVADPDPEDLNVFGPPRFGSGSSSGSGSFYQAKMIRKTLIHTVVL
jgi:hypothetical protein